MEGRKGSYLEKMNDRYVLMLKDGLAQNCEGFKNSFTPDHAEIVLTFKWFFGFF